MVSIKGVSAVISTILILMITLGIAAVASSYLFGWFRSRTVIVLTITEAECTVGGINTWVRNDGTETASDIDVEIAGTTDTCTISVLAAGNTTNCTTLAGSPGVGYHTVSASTTGSRASGSVYCPV